MQAVPSKHDLQGKNILSVSIPLILLLVGVSLVGILYPEIYRAATPSWLTQAIGQDMVDLFLVVPVLTVGTVYAFTSHKVAIYLWIGTLLYLVYTFLIYCFTVKFNPLFIPYCLILGTSTFSLIWFFSSDSEFLFGDTENRTLRFIGIYFIVISVVFYSLWLAEILPATIKNEIPESIIVAGLFTNPVHVLDLSLFLPATFIVGVMALRKNIHATILSPILLTFFILMDLTIAALSVIMTIRNVEGSYVIAVIMTCMAVFSILLLISYFKNEESSDYDN